MTEYNDNPSALSDAMRRAMPPFCQITLVLLFVVARMPRNQFTSWSYRRSVFYKRTPTLQTSSVYWWSNVDTRNRIWTSVAKLWSVPSINQQL